MDVASGDTTVSTYGSATRALLQPSASTGSTGLQGLAALYHRTLLFDMSATAWVNPSGETLMGSGIPVPNTLRENLDEGPNGLQPRPGTWPGLYLFEDDSGTGAIYHYGSPVSSGANPQSTASYELPPTLAPTQIRFNQISGAQLWYYGGASPAYIEIKHVDGTVARFESFNPYSVPNLGRLWRLDKVTDPYDNVADYVYTGSRLTRIDFPSGRKQHFEYDPSWPGWTWSNTPSGLSGLEVSYTQTSGSTTTPLPEQTWGIVFEGALGTSGGRHFGSRVSRIYSASRRVQKEQLTTGQPYTASTVTGQIVHEFTYDPGIINTGTATLTETQRVHTGTVFHQTLLTIGELPNRGILATNYHLTTKKVTSLTKLLHDNEALAVAYGAASRTTDLLPGETLTATTVTDELGNQQRFEYHAGTGKLYSIVHTPVPNADGRPRAHSGIATSDVEPDQIEIYRIFSNGCACQKPIESRVIASMGTPNPPTRTTKYEYDPTTKLLTKRTVPNPATTSLPQPPEIDYLYTYVQAKTGAQAWGAWLLDQEVTPDGTYTYVYTDWLNRADANNHGRIAGTVERRITGVRIQDTLTGTPTTSSTVSEFLLRNLSNNPGGLAYQGPVSGQSRRIIDGDGISTTFDYTGEGWLLNESEHGGTVKRSYAFDAAGNVATISDQVTSTGLQLSWNFPAQSGFGAVYDANSTSGGLLRAAEYYYDRFGHLAISRRNNLDSLGQPPQKHNGSGSPRAWVETQRHFKHRRLLFEFGDRKPLDEAAGGNQFAVTTYGYRANGQLLVVTHPNGAYTEYAYDGYDTLFTSTVKDPTAALTATTPMHFVNPFLEVARIYQSTGSDALWTVITRNAAGAITKIVEPSTTAPAGYTGSTGGAVHQFEIDRMGNVIEARGYSENEVSLLTKRELRYDQLGRMIWEHDSVLGFGSGDRHVAWRYQQNKGSWLQTVERTGIAASTYAYSPSDGFLRSVTDGFGSGNKIEYFYHGGTTFVSQVTRTDLDAVGGTRVTTTAYDVDPFGHIVAIKVGTPQLVHRYAYDSLGRVDRYTDPTVPTGRVQKFLPDGLGRIVEHVRLGDTGAYIHNSSVFEDGGAADGRTKVSQFDDLGHATITHWDFAGRPFIVQNPGGDDAPTPASPNKAMCLYAEYDGASRLKALYDGDLGKTSFWRDGPGRMIQRQLDGYTSDKIALWNTKDVLRRDAIGRIKFTEYVGGVANNVLQGVEEFDEDSLGRTHAERFAFAAAPAHVLETKSTFSGGKAFRSGLEYEDNLGTESAKMSFIPDAIGRLSEVQWDRAPGSIGAMQVLAQYGWAGDLRRTRTVRYGNTEFPQGRSTFSYDVYGRLTQIKDDVYTAVSTFSTKSQFDYGYDAASNLVREEYAKVDGSKGDLFAYDAYHRLKEAWLGVDQATMNAAKAVPPTFPVGFDPAHMHEHLTYGLDDANNRTTSSSQTGASPDVTTYTLQGSAHSQGPSNRYDTVSVPNATLEYDDRGNLTYDGRFVFKYDYMNRLQEVWRVLGGGQPAVGAERFAVVQQGALEGAQETVWLEVPDLYTRLARQHTDPVFRARLKATISGGVTRITPTAQGGAPVAGDLELVAVYLYDAFNRRTQSTLVGLETQIHTWDGWRQTAQHKVEQVGSVWQATPTKQFVWGSRLDELVAYRRLNGSAWENYYVLHGGQDTAAKLVDSSGTVVEQYEYDPYGRVTCYVQVSGTWTAFSASQFGLPLLWKSIRLDEITGLLQMRHRYYSVDLGRFLTLDPLGEWADPLNGGNGYAYVGERVLIMGDPLGLQSDAEKVTSLLARGDGNSAEERPDFRGRGINPSSCCGAFDPGFRPHPDWGRECVEGILIASAIPLGWLAGRVLYALIEIVAAYHGMP